MSTIELFFTSIVASLVIALAVLLVYHGHSKGMFVKHGVSEDSTEFNPLADMFNFVNVIVTILSQEQVLQIIFGGPIALLVLSVIFPIPVLHPVAISLLSSLGQVFSQTLTSMINAVNHLFGLPSIPSNSTITNPCVGH